jgi:zinc transport system substrate-binding protein
MSLRIVRAFTKASVASIVVVLGVSGLLAACSSASADPPGTSVVASFYPLAAAAEQVGGADVAVTNLTAPGVEPHDLELTPDQMEAITTADVVLYLGGGFQPAVEDAINDAQGTVVDVSEGLRDLPVPPTETSPGLTADPHVWLDPVAYRQVVGRVESALAEVDPAGASTFATNADAFTARLASLDREYRSGLSSCDRTVIVASHAAFAYLAQRYGLQQEPIAGLSPEAEPDPQRLADLKALVEQTGVTTIFTEDLVSPKVAETLASEAGISTAVLNPLESITADQLAAGQDYVSIMQENLETLRSALGCA